MDRYRIPKSVLDRIPTPCYVIDTQKLEDNLKILASVQDRTGCKILLALKGFAMFSLFPIIKKYLPAISVSSLNEARLGFEQFGKKVHLVVPAYKESEFGELKACADHIVFNSFAQWQKFKSLLDDKIEVGLRINPQYSEIKFEIYNPCAKHSRLGITLDKFEGQNLDGITGLHFHTMCEQNSDTLERTLKIVEKNFGHLLKQIKWVNFGGGHHITRPDYDVEKLCSIIADFKSRYPLEIFLEPGEAIALNTGVLITSVLDITYNEMDIAILDTSAAAHMPDVLEMPYRPQIIDAADPGKLPHTYRLAGTSCLAGDIIGDYSFDRPLKVGDKIVLLDMAHYTMVKNNTFNGINLPSIATYDPRIEKLNIIKKFGYEDYKNRLS